MRRLTAVLAVALLTFTLLGAAPAAGAQAGTLAPARWVRIGANLFVDDVDDVLATVRQAKAAGANGVLFADTKVTSMSAPGSEQLAARYEPLVRRLRDGVNAEGMQFVIATAPTGYCGPVLAHDVNLAAGYPVRNAPLVARGGRLVPVPTARVTNGSFETHEGNVPTGWGFQDRPGEVSFIDTSVARVGSASLRLEGRDNGMARLFGEFDVQPFQQYRLRFWAKAENLSAGFLGPYIVDANDTGHALSQQHYSFPEASGTRSYRPSLANASFDWTEMRVAFNSTDATRVRIGLGVWSATGGTLWIDSVRVESVPTLNLVRRASLPLTLTTASGRTLVEGTDVAPLVDRQLGQIGHPGNYDTYHAAPAVSLRAGSGVPEGERVLFSGWHTQLTAGGQVGCSWQEPKIFEVMARIHRNANRVIQPDGIFLDIDEVRSGGWEPAEQAFPNSGAAFGDHVARVAADARRITGRPVYLWGDMFDPTQNAVGRYYQVAGSLEGSWQKLDPAAVTVVNWKDTPAGETGGIAASVDHFARLGFRQIAAGFYDDDVATNHAAWQTALAGQPGIVGSMYTTWRDDYRQLPAFGQLWWGT